MKIKSVTEDGFMLESGEFFQHGMEIKDVSLEQFQEILDTVEVEIKNMLKKLEL